MKALHPVYQPAILFVCWEVRPTYLSTGLSGLDAVCGLLLLRVCLVCLLWSGRSSSHLISGPPWRSDPEWLPPPGEACAPWCWKLPALWPSPLAAAPYWRSSWLVSAPLLLPVYEAHCAVFRTFLCDLGHSPHKVHMICQRLLHNGTFGFI